MQDDFDDNPYDDRQNAETSGRTDSEDLFNPEWKPRSPFRFLRFLLPPLIGGVLGFVLAVAVFYITYYIVGILGAIFLGVICAVLTRAAFESIDVESKPLIMGFGFLVGAFAAYVFFGAMIWVFVNHAAREVRNQRQGEQIRVVVAPDEEANAPEAADPADTEEALVDIPDEETPEEADDVAADNEGGPEVKRFTLEDIILMVHQANPDMSAEERYGIELSARASFGHGISPQKSLLRPAWVFYATKILTFNENTQNAWIFFLIVGGIVILAAGFVAKDPMPNSQAAVLATGPTNKINPDVKP